VPQYKGRVAKIVYRNEAFCIFVLNTGTESFKCKGTFVGVEVRQHMDCIVEGEFKTSKFGNDLNVRSLEEVEPNDVDGITRYLEANVHGVGWATARKVAAHFGGDTVAILSADPGRINECIFCTDSQKELIYKALSENKGKRDISIFLMSFDVKPAVVEKIYKKWGTDAVRLLTEDPYKLMEIRGIGFKRADEIATRMGIDARSPIRIRAVIHYLLDDVGGSDGHLFLLKADLQKRVLKMLDDVPAAIYRECMSTLQLDGKVVIDGNRCYSSRHHNNEVGAAMLLSAMMTPIHRDFDLDAFITQYEAAHSTATVPFRLSDEQVTAIETALVSKVLVITGLPGTGKTTVLKAIVDMYETFVPKVALMAPTGIASKRLRAATGRPAGTIHRTLGCRGDAGWEHNERNPLPDQAVVVDEASMVDMSLMHRLLKGIRPDACLVMVGDVAQLPSVGPGNVLSELIKSGCIPVVQLTTIHRQAEASDIIINAHRIQRGEDLVIDNGGDTDFKFVHMSDEDKLLDRMLRTAAALQKRGHQFQCLSPRHAGTLGVQNLNDRLRDVLNPDIGQDSMDFKVKEFRCGDRVMVTRNNYNLGVFNGDIGTIVSIDRKQKVIHFQVDGNSLNTTFKFGEAIADLVLAYCVTIHKSQGSEWDIVMMPMVKAFSIQLVRNLFYTGVTRAKRKVLVYGQLGAAEKAIRNNKVSRRNTAFGERLRNVLGE